jgi:hypothetical protein
MKASNNLIKPFLDGILQDIREIYSEEDFTYEQQWINDRATGSNPTLLVNSLCRMGKALERALITGENLVIGSNELQERDSGTAFPIFLNSLWQRLFYFSGRPRYKSVDDYLVIVKEPDLVEWTIDASTAEQQSAALAVYCLRQFYLGLSKLTTLECLLLFRRGSVEVLRASPEELGTALLRSLRCTNVGEDNCVSYILRRRRNPGYVSSIF